MCKERKKLFLAEERDRYILSVCLHIYWWAWGDYFIHQWRITQPTHCNDRQCHSIFNMVFFIKIALYAMTLFAFLVNPLLMLCIHFAFEIFSCLLRNSNINKTNCVALFHQTLFHGDYLRNKVLILTFVESLTVIEPNSRIDMRSSNSDKSVSVSSH